MSSTDAIKERIKQLISVKDLSPAKFADMIGVQRSGISHILSGRNKPSLDVLNKILVTFPDISGDWLITGSGDMMKGGQRKQEPSTELFPPQEAKEAVREPENVNREEEMPPYGKHNIKSQTDTMEKTPAVDKESVVRPLTTAGGKKIEKIVVFYADRTFREYSPD